MGVIRRYNKYIGLDTIPVLIDDKAPLSEYFNVVEFQDTISQGRSSFLIGGSNHLKTDTELKVEIINNATKKTIYTEAVSEYLEGQHRRVSIEIYDDIDTFGDCTMYIVGELKPIIYPYYEIHNNLDDSTIVATRVDEDGTRNTQPYPREEVLANPEPPEGAVNVPEEWKDTYNVRWSKQFYVNGASVNTQPIFFYKQPKMWVSEIVKGFVKETYPTSSETFTSTIVGSPLNEIIGKTSQKSEDTPGADLAGAQDSYKSKIYSGGGKSSGLSKRGRTVRRSSPEKEEYTIEIQTSDADLKHVGGKATITNPVIDNSKFVLEDYHEVPVSFEVDIKNVKNKNSVIPTKPFTIKDTRTNDEIVVPLKSADVSIEYTPAPTQSVSEVNFRSFADVRVSRLRTFSGDIFRTKLYAKNNDAFGDYELIADVPVESPELLYDVFSADGSKRTGYFADQNTINSYWTSGSNTVLLHSSDKMLNSMHISSSVYDINTIAKVDYTSSINFEDDVTYNFRSRIIGVPKPQSDGETLAKMSIHISGSGFPSNHKFGSSIGRQLETPDGQPGFYIVDNREIQGDFGIVEETFSAIPSGSGVLQFVIHSGEWYVQDVTLRPATDTGFNPDWIRVVAPIPAFSQQRPDTYEFLAEFYDVNNNIAETISFNTGSVFEGGNDYIVGTDNVLSGSMVIGNSIGAGIEMAGAHSGHVRSIGYDGFISASNGSGQSGFLIYSGSVLPGSGDNYTGVGLELVAPEGSGSLRFSTNPSRFEVIADSFFVGSDSQFISGSQGNIEISSSNFWLTPDGDVYMTGTVSASAGNIGGWNIVTGSLYNLTNSEYTGMSTAGDTRFFAGATALNLSGSAVFNVKANGDVTGSQVLFTGGKIGGWDMNSGSLSNSSTDGGVRLEAENEAGLYISDIYQNDIITVASKSMYTLGSATDEIVNDSFEFDPGSLWTGSDGYHVGNASTPLSVVSWSLDVTGPVSHSITRRLGTGFELYNAAVVGDNTYDVVYPGQFAPTTELSRSYAEVSASYLLNNTYELYQIVSASSQTAQRWTAGGVVSLAFVAKMSHSLAGAGYDRGLEQQKYRVEYWDSGTWTKFIPTSIGSTWARYNLGTKYTSIKASGQLPVTTDKLRVVMSGSINPDTIQKSKEHVFDEWFASVRSLLKFGSLHPKTEILLGDGSSTAIIDDLKVNQSVWAYDTDKSVDTEAFVLTKTKHHATSSLHINGTDIITSHTQLFTTDTGIKLASDLTTADKLIDKNGANVNISSISVEKGDYPLFNLVLSYKEGGEINDNLYYYAGATPVRSNHTGSASGKYDDEQKDVTKLVPPNAAKYPYTELSFDNFRLVQDIPRVELSKDGFLLYQSEISYIKMTPSDFIIRTPSDSGMGIGQSVTSNLATTNTGVYGQLAAPALQAYEAEPSDIGTTPFAGGINEYAMGNHRHDLPFSTLNTVAAEGTFDSIDVNSLTFGGGGSFNITGSLAVSSSNDSYFIGGGGVGIGTTNPQTALHVNGTISGSAILIAGGIPNSALTNSTISYGGISLSLGSSDATPAFDLIDATNYPYSSLTGIPANIVSSSIQIDHGSVSGLSDDDHSQYNLLAGRAGGQTNYGGINASDSLTLEGTSNATDGYVLINPNGGNVGIGNVAPIHELTISGVMSSSAGGVLNAIDIGKTLASTIQHKTAGGDLYFQYSHNGNIIFNMGGGNVGIGTTNPSSKLHVVGDSLFTGDATFTGTVTAQEFHAEFVSSSIIYESGSTKFGDTMDDIHWRTGSMYISGSDHHFFGNVGIGTTNPLTILDIHSTYPRMQLTDTNAYSVANLGGGISFKYIYNSAGTYTTGPVIAMEKESEADGNYGAALKFTTRKHGSSASEKMRITGAGSVGIGTTNPTTVLHVQDATNSYMKYDINGSLLLSRAASLYGPAVTFQEDSTRTWDIKVDTDGGNTNSLMFRDASNIIMTLKQGGNIGIGTTTPLERLDINGTNPRIFLDDSTAPGTTTNRLYALSGQLYWNGVGLTSAGSLPSPIEGNVMRGNGSTSWQTTDSLYIASSSGYVGIGTTAPITKLDIYKSGASTGLSIRTVTTGDPYLRFYNNTTIVADIWYDRTGDYFGINSQSPSKKLVLNKGGANVGIGTTNPSSILHTYDGYVTFERNSNKLYLNPDSSALGNYSEISTDGLPISFATTPGDISMYINNNKRIGIDTTSPLSKLHIVGHVSESHSGSLFRVEGSSGSLFEVVDSLSGSLMSVNDVSGLPILEVFDDDRVVMGTFNQNALVVTGSNVGIGISVPTTKLQVNGTISGSSLDISGNIVVDGTVDGVDILTTSSSLSTRVSTNETNITNLQTDSGSFSTRVSTNETNITNLQTDSGSFSTRISTNETNITAISNYTASLPTNLDGLTDSEVSQLQNINTTTISNTQWGYLGSSNQGIATTNNVVFASVTSSNFDINGGDISGSVVINKSPVVNFNSGDVQGSLTLTNLASGTGALTIQTSSVEGTMLNSNVADTTTLALSTNTLSVLKVPNALTAGTNLNSTGTFDGSTARTINLDSNISVTSITASNAQITNLTIDTIVSASNLDVSGTITAPNIGAGTDNSVVVLNSSGLFKTDEIDSRVWGSSLVDGSGGVNQISYWSDSNTQTGTSTFVYSGSNVGIGTINPDAVLHLSSSGTTFQEKVFQVNNAFTVFKDGNISIGDSTYDYQPLTIASSSEAGAVKLYIRNSFVSASALTETSELQFGFSVQAGKIIVGKENDFSTAANRDSYMAFATDNSNTISERMRITSGGYLGIGTTSPQSELHVWGTISGSALNITGTSTLTGNIIPSVDDTYNLGDATHRWADIYSTQTTTGGVFEVGLRTQEISEFETGTLVVWRNGKLVQSDKKCDTMVQGVVKNGKPEPIVMGAELILMTGKIKEGDYIMTSNKSGHGCKYKSKRKYLFITEHKPGTIIAQALEDGNGDSYTIKAMIRKF